MIRNDAAARDLLFSILDDEDITEEIVIEWPENYPGSDRLIRRTTVGLGRFDPNAGH